MITGSIYEDDNVFCFDCWTREQAIGGAASVLDTIDPIDPSDATPFWVVDKCVFCGADVKHKDTKLRA